MKIKKKSLLGIIIIFIAFSFIYFSWYEVKIYAPYPYNDGNFDYKLSYNEAKRYIEIFNNEKFYVLESVGVYGQPTDSNCCRIEMRIGFTNKTIYLHHLSSMVFTYSIDDSSNNVSNRVFHYFSWFGDFFKYHLEVDKKYNSYIQQEGTREWWYCSSCDPYTQGIGLLWLGSDDYWSEIYANGFIPLDQIVEQLEYSYKQQGYISPFENYEYGKETLWDIYKKINPETNVFTYNGLEIMYVNGKRDLNSNFIVRATNYIRKPIE